jgi:photosystem II stability/assembly factor-like uncharacterized protein
MKKLGVLFTLLVILIIGPPDIFTQDELFWQNPLPQGNHIRSIIAMDENNFIAAGLSGFYIKSSDGGSSWDIEYFSQNYSISELKYFSDINTLFAYVSDLSIGGTILYKSTDKGLTWDSLYTFDNWGLSDIDKNFDNVLFGVGGSGKILKSTDYGFNWDTVSSNTNANLTAIQFFDNQNGCIVGYNGLILRTSDNGNSWSTIQNSTTEHLFALDFLNSNIGIAFGQQGYSFQENSIVITTDAGMTWTKVVVNNPLGALLDLKFIDSSNVIIVGGNDDYFGGREPIVIRSSDGGDSWIDFSSQFSRGISSISFISPDEAICGGFSGVIYHSYNSGLNWNKISSGVFPYFNDLCTYDSSGFYAIGRDNNADVVILLGTKNGGQNWQLKDTPYFLNLGGLDFIDENYGMIAGDNLIYFTLDGCNTWNQGTAPIASFMDVKIINSNKAILSGDQGTLLKSSDGGYTWFSVNSGATGNLERIIFKDSLNGLIIANPGPSIITTDGGEIWTAINYTFDWLNDGTFFGNDNIALAGSNGKIYISENGGQTWSEKIVANSGTYISSISFRNSLEGIAVGETGLILNTSDGGNNWTSQFSLTLIDLIDVEYSEGESVVIIGKEGVILGSEKGMITLGIDNQFTNESPNTFYLSQNYPNPFNPSTTISWQSPVGSHQTLKIYDVLGNEVATLVDEYKPAGTYEVEWNATGFTSGVYFYALEVQDKFFEVKKMILLR